MNDSQLKQVLKQVSDKSKDDSNQVQDPELTPKKRDIQRLEDAIELEIANSRLTSYILLNQVYCAILNWLCSLIISPKEENKSDSFNFKKRNFLSIITLLLVLFICSNIDLNTLYPGGEIPFCWILSQEIARSILMALASCASLMLLFPLTNTIKNRLSTKQHNKNL